MRKAGFCCVALLGPPYSVRCGEVQSLASASEICVINHAVSGNTNMGIQTPRCGGTHL